MTAAAFAAGAAAQLFIRRHPSQFQSFVDVLLNGFLDLVKFFLGVQKPARNGVI